MAVIYIFGFVAAGALFGASLATVYQLSRLELWRERADQLARKVDELSEQLIDRDITNAKLRRRLVELGDVKP